MRPRNAAAGLYGAFLAVLAAAPAPAQQPDGLSPPVWGDGWHYTASRDGRGHWLNLTAAEAVVKTPEGTFTAADWPGQQPPTLFADCREGEFPLHIMVAFSTTGDAPTASSVSLRNFWWWLTRTDPPPHVFPATITLGTAYHVVRVRCHDPDAGVFSGEPPPKPPPPDKEKGTMKKTTITAAALLLAVALGCDGGAPSTDPPTDNHVFEDLLSALDIEGPVGVYGFENIPNPDLAAEIREYAERTETVVTCDSWFCEGPEGAGVWINFYETDPALQDRVEVVVEMRNCGLCGPIVAVDITRTDGRWQVGEAAQIGMVM